MEKPTSAELAAQIAALEKQAAEAKAAEDAAAAAEGAPKSLDERVTALETKLAGLDAPHVGKLREIIERFFPL